LQREHKSRVICEEKIAQRHKKWRINEESSRPLKFRGFYKVKDR
jgi:hypothetical protein